MIGKGNDQISPSIRVFSDRRAEFLIVSISDYLKRTSRPPRFEISNRQTGGKIKGAQCEKAQRKVQELISPLRISADRRAEISRRIIGGEIIDTFLYIGYHLVMGFRNWKPKEIAMEQNELIDQIEDTAKYCRGEGQSVEINYSLPYVAIERGEDDFYFFQGEEASELLETVPDWINDEDYFLWVAQGW